MIRAHFATLILLFILWFARMFYVKQNSGKIVGGKVSIPKALWLGYAIGSWYFVPFLFLTWGEVDPWLKIIFVGHLMSWWVRAPIELIMIYKYFNWTPIYGITHDVLHILMLVGLYFWRFGINAVTSMTAPNQLAVAYIWVTVLALVMEITFAYLFRKTRSFEKEAHKIYFASDDPVYRMINRLTRGTVIFVYTHFLLQLFLFYTIAISNPGE